MNLADLIDAALPQTQCTRCGYPDCRSYANAIAAAEADINQCPPGGAEGIVRLARISGRPIRPLSPDCGQEARRGLAVIDEALCIGCTLCIKACPADCIVGAPKAMHWIVAEQCTGCELCIPACPVDCISMIPVTTLTGWSAWSEEQADETRERYRFRQFRRHREAVESEARLLARSGAAAEVAGDDALIEPVAPPPGSLQPTPPDRKRVAIAAALARARAKRSAADG